MRELLDRRRLVRAGLVGAAGVSGLVAVGLAKRAGLVPPDHGGLYGVGETLTYAAHRLLTSRRSLAREFNRRDISAVAPINGPPPTSEGYFAALENDFVNWRLTVDGLVARPYSFSLAELQRLPSRSQITLHVCEEGWSFIAEWSGVPLSELLHAVGASARAKYVVFYPFDEWWDSLDMADALHPQTLLAYRMNGESLPIAHGAPLRLRVARQLGYKSIKYLSRMSVVDTVLGIGKGLGARTPEVGYSWYAGI